MERTSSLVRLNFVLDEWFDWLVMVNFCGSADGNGKLAEL